MWSYIAKVERVVDGDTLDLSVDLGFKISFDIRVRLLGVDTPEVYSAKKGSEERKLGMAATEFVEQWVEENGTGDDKQLLVETHKDKKGKFGRWLAELRSLEEGSVTLNQALISSGHAKPYM